MNLQTRVTKLEQGTIPKGRRQMNVFNDRHLVEALELLAAGGDLLALVGDADYKERLTGAGADVLHYSGNVKPSML